jgi:hypothetical protein
VSRSRGATAGSQSPQLETDDEEPPSSSGEEEVDDVELGPRELLQDMVDAAIGCGDPVRVRVALTAATDWDTGAELHGSRPLGASVDTLAGYAAENGWGDADEQATAPTAPVDGGCPVLLLPDIQMLVALAGQQLLQDGRQLGGFRAVSFTEPGKLGLIWQALTDAGATRVTIKRVVPGSAAAQAALAAGMTLAAINGEPVTHLPLSEVVDLIKTLNGVKTEQQPLFLAFDGAVEVAQPAEAAESVAAAAGVGGSRSVALARWKAGQGAPPAPALNKGAQLKKGILRRMSLKGSVK